MSKDNDDNAQQPKGKMIEIDTNRGAQGRVIGNNDTSLPGNITTWFGFRS